MFEWVLGILSMYAFIEPWPSVSDWEDGIVKFVSWRSFFGESLAQMKHVDLSVWLSAVLYEASVVRSSLNTCYLFFSFIVVFICLLLLSYSKWGIFPVRSPVLYLYSWLVKHCINHVLFTSQPAPPLLLWYQIVNLVQFKCFFFFLVGGSPPGRPIADEENLSSLTTRTWGYWSADGDDDDDDGDNDDDA